MAADLIGDGHFLTLTALETSGDRAAQSPAAIVPTDH